MKYLLFLLLLCSCKNYYDNSHDSSFHNYKIEILYKSGLKDTIQVRAQDIVQDRTSFQATTILYAVQGFDNMDVVADDFVKFKILEQK